MNNPQDSNNNDIRGDRDGFLKDLLNQLKESDLTIRTRVNDQRLARLAEYDLSHGFLKTKLNSNDLQKKFFELKKLVKRGTFTLKALEDNIYEKWGITEENSTPKREQSGVTNSIYKFNLDDIVVADIPYDSPENT